MTTKKEIKDTYDTKSPHVPNNVRIGGALDWEVYNTTTTTDSSLQDSSMSSSVSGSELLEFEAVIS